MTFKKLLSVLLAVLMVFSLAGFAFAENDHDGYVLLPTADSDDFEIGTWWYDRDGMIDYGSGFGDTDFYESLTFYLSEDETTLLVCAPEYSFSIDVGSEGNGWDWYIFFLQRHGIYEVNAVTAVINADEYTEVTFIPGGYAMLQEYAMLQFTAPVSANYSLIISEYSGALYTEAYVYDNPEGTGDPIKTFNVGASVYFSANTTVYIKVRYDVERECTCRIINKLNCVHYGTFLNENDERYYKFYDEDDDAYCDVCGEKILYDVSFGSATEITFGRSGTAWIRFIPEVYGYYKIQGDVECDNPWVNQDLHAYPDCGYGSKFAQMEAGKAYYLRISGNESVTVEIISSCRHIFEFADLDGDCICDECDKRIIYPIELNEPLTVSIPAEDIIYAKVTNDNAGSYRITASDETYIIRGSEWLFEDFTSVGIVNVNFNNYIFIEDDTICYVRLSNLTRKCNRSITLTLETCEHKNGTYSESYRYNEIEPTCSREGGYDTITRCIDCCCYIDTVHTKIDKLPHSPGEWYVLTEPTCSAEGQRVKKCTECGETVETETIEKRIHTPDGWKVKTPATCTAEGEEILKCTVCGEEFMSRPIEMIAHPDDNNDGWCDVCNAEVGEHPKPGNKCKYCGGVHEGAFGKIIQLFHNILYFFKNLFK